MKKGLTISMVIKADACNFGEGFGNVATLKKKVIDGEMRTYISRNALKYSLYNLLEWDNTPVVASGSGNKAVVQYDPKATISEYPEIDLRGYMRTIKEESADTRAAVVRVSDAVSLNAYRGDMDFINNIGMAKRIGANNNLANAEMHHDYFAYTLTIDLDRVGVNRDEEIPSAEKAERVKKVLSGVEFLFRDCKGVRENLSPIFVIGGVYDRKNPFFLNRIKGQNGTLDIELLNETVENADIAASTFAGCVSGMFKNADEVKAFAPLSVKEAFNALRDAVDKVYE